MVKVFDSGAWLLDGKDIVLDALELSARYGGNDAVPTKDEAARNTMAYRVLEAHNTSGSMEKLQIKFDALASHDITYVGIVQTARASGLTRFEIPYVLTNCHNSLCAVGGTINEDDHRFGLSAARKYGGVYVPAHQGVIHQYMREMMAGCGKMILGSDSHTRYGALGTLAIGEGGPELVKQLLGRTYDVDRPGVVAVHLTGRPERGVGPQDVALAIIGAVFAKGYVKNKVMEFVGEGVHNLSAEYRIGVDVMTTETACLSSIWSTDDVIKDYLTLHGRPEDYKELAPGKIAWYDGLITVDLSKVKPMIALPFHPSNVYTIEELSANAMDILAKVEADGARAIDNPRIRFTLRDKVKDGKLHVQQGVIAGCAGGTYENIVEAANILDYTSIGSGDFSLSVYPSSQPVNLALTKNGVMTRLMTSGATIRTAFCGPCFGAGDVPANGGLSVRHTTRNFPNREGSKPQSGQIASVALMDARSVAATAAMGGVLTAATGFEKDGSHPKYFFEADIYKSRCYDGRGKAEPDAELVYGPGITDWPAMEPLVEDLLLKVVTLITDPVTTTDELIPSGETSSYRSNPLALAEFALSRKDPGYVPAAKAVKELEEARRKGMLPAHFSQELRAAYDAAQKVDPSFTSAKIGIGSAVYAKKPGDGSAREQAASCQKVLGTFANIAEEYATKRYRSNLINWGMLPFLTEGIPFEKGDWLYIPGIRAAVMEKRDEIKAYVLSEGDAKEFTLALSGLTDDEREIILDGCLINYYRAGK